MNVAVLAIGNEVLCGKIVDTNGAYISQKVEQVGAKVVHREVVLDTIPDIVLGLNHAYEYADFVITIGGLGPTVDDLTRDGVAEFFGEELVYDEHIHANIARMFKQMNRAMPDNNKRQAYRFAGGEVIANPNGTAPGLALTKEGKHVFLLPGPPNELLPMFDEYVLPIVKNLVDVPLVTRSYRLYGIGESPAEAKVIHLYEKYPLLDIAPYASISYVDYLVSAKETDVAQIDRFEQDFWALVGEHYVGSADVPLCERVMEKLLDQDLTIAVAESCTGGMLAARLIDVAGASGAFLEGLVVYSNVSKQLRLGVSSTTLETFGAVSAEVSAEMAAGVAAQSRADVTVSITGVAGPGGGSEEKPVGTVYIGLLIDGEVTVQRYHFTGSRDKIRERATNQALYLLFKILSD
ncbi:MAG: competence/damage-inducible protein A [Turicibacter sp.]|nr:competence/damage-inducible protein A [Turicibacter sp.]